MGHELSLRNMYPLKTLQHCVCPPQFLLVVALLPCGHVNVNELHEMQCVYCTRINHKKRVTEADSQSLPLLQKVKAKLLREAIN